MTTARRAGLALCVAYIALVGVLFILGAGILAAYLTMPTWLLVGALILQVKPGSDFAVTLVSETGNLALLMASAAVNAAIVYVVVRLLSKAISPPGA